MLNVKIVSAKRSCLGYREKIETEFDERLSRRKSLETTPVRVETWDPHYTWLTYEEVRHAAELMGCGFVQLGLPTGQEAKVGIYSNNRPEWDITQLACCMFSYVVVPLYDSQSVEAQTYIINQTELKTICVDNEAKIEKLLKAKSELPTLETIVCFDGRVSNATAGLVQAHGWKLLLYEQLKALGEEKPTPIRPAKPDDMFIILYTSGTTGMPKGVVLKQKSVAAEVESIYRVFKVSRLSVVSWLLVEMKDELFDLLVLF